MSSQDTAACCRLFAAFPWGATAASPGCALLDGLNGRCDRRRLRRHRQRIVTSALLLKPCAHHVPPSSKYPKCPSSTRHHSATSSAARANMRQTTLPISTRAPGSLVQRHRQDPDRAHDRRAACRCFLSIYDFPTYKSGVYTHQSGGMLGGHAVEMIGWGVENGVDYWWIKNSWNEQWETMVTSRSNAALTSAGLRMM